MQMDYSPQVPFGYDYPPPAPPRPPSPPRRQRACQACSKGKARCIFRDENIGRHCDRCLKMGLECMQQPIEFRRRPFKLTPAAHSAPSMAKQGLGAPRLPSRVLPEDMNHSGESAIDPALAPAGQSTYRSPYGGSPGHLYPTVPLPQPSASQLAAAEEQPHYVALPASAPTQSSTPSSTPPQPATAAAAFPPSPGYGLSWDAAALAVTEFKASFMPYFPFVALDPDATAQSLFTKSPFVFRAVMLAAARLPEARRKSLKRNVMAYLSQHLLVDEERSLDLLQGLLVVIAWCEPSFYIDRSITHLINLAVGYAYNLGLTKLPPPMHQGKAILFDLPNAHGKETEATENRRSTPQSNKNPEAVHTFHEQRALLGCYYLMSVNSAQFVRVNLFRSPYVDVCCQRLARAGTAETDASLVTMVHLQQTVDKIIENSGNSQGANKSRSPRSGFAAFVSTPRDLEAQLDSLVDSAGLRAAVQTFEWWAENGRSGLSPTLSQTTMALHYYHVRLRLFEPATFLFNDSSSSASRSHSNSPSSSGERPLTRLQCLQRCLRSAKNFFSTLLETPPEAHLHDTFVSAAEILSVLITSCKLLLLDVDGWSLDRARDTLQLPAVLDGLSERFVTAGGLYRLRNNENIGGARSAPTGPAEAADPQGPFPKYVQKMAWIKNWYETRVVQGETSLGPTAAETQALSGNTYTASEGQSNQFWLGLLGNGAWDFQF